jgi:hypothetical protein
MIQVYYAQFRLIGYIVFNSAPDNANAVWWKASLEDVYRDTLCASNIIPDNASELQRQSTPVCSEFIPAFVEQRLTQCSVG